MAKTGLEMESRLCANLKEYGCFILKNGHFDHEYKLDFVVVRFPGHPTVLSLGVQFTTRTDNLEKIKQFVQIHQTIRVTDQVVYLELDPRLDLSRGGALAVFAVLLNLKFNQ